MPASRAQTRGMKRVLLLIVVLLGGCGSSIAPPDSDDGGGADTGPSPDDAGPDTAPDASAPGDAGLAPEDADTDASAATDAGALPRDCGDALLCDDFETGTIDTSLWMIQANRAEVRVDDTRAAHGRYALHVTAEAVASSGMIRERSTFPAENNAFYVRAYVRRCRGASPPRSACCA